MKDTLEIALDVLEGLLVLNHPDRVKDGKYHGLATIDDLLSKIGPLIGRMYSEDLVCAQSYENRLNEILVPYDLVY